MGVVGGLVGGLVATGGNVVLQMLTTSKQHEATKVEWSREDKLRYLDERREFYVRFLSELREAETTMGKVAGLIGSGQSAQLELRRLSQVHSSLWDVESRMDLLPPDAVRAIAGRPGSVASAMIHPSRAAMFQERPDPGTAEVARDLQSRYHSIEHDFIVAARSDLNTSRPR